MSGSTALSEGRDLALELRDALSELDRGRGGDALRAVRARVSAVRAKLEGLGPRAAASGAPALADAAGALATHLDSVPPPSPEPAASVESRGAWLAFRARVQPAYEALVQALSEARVEVPSLRPTNYARNALHLASALSGVVALELLPSHAATVGLAAGFALTGWTMEVTRRRSSAVNRFCLALFGRTAHPHEAHRVNSATWYATALVLLALAGADAASAVALLVLGVGDPVAALVGRRFGRVPLVHGRTLEGTLGFLASGTAAGLGFLLALHPEVGVGTALAAAAAGATLGALAELATRRLDDNLTIPLAAFAGAWLVLGA